MTDAQDPYRDVAWAQSLDDIDREIVRLALLCRARILAPGVIERVLQKDASVCETENAVAFAKLREMLMMHFGVWQRAAHDLGPVRTSQIEQSVIERLRKSHPDLADQLSGT